MTAFDWTIIAVLGFFILCSLVALAAAYLDREVERDASDWWRDV